MSWSFTFDEEADDQLQALYLRQRTLLQTAVSLMGVDRSWVAGGDDFGHVLLWWHSPLRQRLSCEAIDVDGTIVLSATTDIIQVDGRRLGTEGPGFVENLLSDINVRNATRSAWWFDPLDSIIRASTRVYDADVDQTAVSAFAAAAVLQAWESVNILSMVGDAAPNIGVPCLSRHPVRGARERPDPVVLMVQHDLHANPRPPQRELPRCLAELSVWSTVSYRADRIVAQPSAAERSSVIVELEPRHPTLGGGVAITVVSDFGEETRSPAFIAAQLNSREARGRGEHDLGGAWAASPTGVPRFRSFWPEPMAAQTSLLERAAAECAARCLWVESEVI